MKLLKDLTPTGKLVVTTAFIVGTTIAVYFSLPLINNKLKTYSNYNIEKLQETNFEISPLEKQLAEQELNQYLELKIEEYQNITKTNFYQPPGP